MADTEVTLNVVEKKPKMHVLRVCTWHGNTPAPILQLLLQNSRSSLSLSLSQVHQIGLKVYIGGTQVVILVSMVTWLTHGQVVKKTGGVSAAINIGLMVPKSSSVFHRIHLKGEFCLIVDFM